MCHALNVICVIAVQRAFLCYLFLYMSVSVNKVKPNIKLPLYLSFFCTKCGKSLDLFSSGLSQSRCFAMTLIPFLSNNY